jgi:hypothetical protein
MPVKLVSVTKTSSIVVDGEKVERARVVTLSHNWTEREITLFKKIVKQGGVVSIQGKKYECTPIDKITTTKGWADGGVEIMHGPEKE